MLAKTVCTDRQYEALKKRADAAAAKPVDYIENSIYLRDRDEILKTAREKVDQVLELQNAD